MKQCLFVFIIIIFCSCSSTKLTHKVLSNVICDVIGEDYYHESYLTFCERTDTFDVAYSFYEENKRKVEEPIIFCFGRLSNPGIRDEYKKESSWDSDELQLLKKLKNTLCGMRLDINQLHEMCGYSFKLTTHEKKDSIKPSERVIFRISKLAFSNDKKTACFFIEGGRGAAGYWDAIIFVEKDIEIWKVIKKVPINVH